MYLKEVEIENVGPVENVKIEFAQKDGKPLPTIIVGENGSGKSIFLSHIVNSLVIGRQEVFDDSEVEKDKVYKYRSPNYVSAGENYSFSSVTFDSGLHTKEWQLKYQKKIFEEKFPDTPQKNGWDKIKDDATSSIETNFANNQEATKKLFAEQCCLYFPADRFEIPAWLNTGSLRQQVTYSNLKHIDRFSNRDVICRSPLKDNRNWVMDLLLDRSIYEIKLRDIRIKSSNGQIENVQVFDGYSGASANLYRAIIRVLQIFFKGDQRIRLGVGDRGTRRISVQRGDEVLVPDLFQLSTGEAQILNFFLSILRDYDLSGAPFKEISDIKGIVVVDEIDSHLHIAFQRDFLPELISLMPNVQFIITTHSPLFLIGMEDRFGTDGVSIYNMPSGKRVFAEDFSEFNSAYESIQRTLHHRKTIQSALDQKLNPTVFVEGEYDINYIRTAAKLLGKNDILDRINLVQASGASNLDRIWKGCRPPFSDHVANKVILLYDCDTNKPNESYGLVYRRTIPCPSNSVIHTGIEALFSAETIDKLEKHSSMFIDRHGETTERVRGTDRIIPARISINKDEKKNICTWLCANGSKEDFSEFHHLFNIIEEILALNSTDSTQ